MYGFFYVVTKCIALNVKVNIEVIKIWTNKKLLIFFIKTRINKRNGKLCGEERG